MTVSDCRRRKASNAKGGGMFFVRATSVDARVTTICADEARSAVLHHLKMKRSGLAPTVTDWAGQTVSFAELKRQADADRTRGAQH